MTRYDVSQLKVLLDSAEQVLVLLPDNLGWDHLAAGLALRLGITNQGKKVQVVSPTEITAEFNRLIGIDQVKGHLSNKSLVISFDHPWEQVRKVHSMKNVETGKLEVIIEPQHGYPSVNHQSVNYDYQKSKADVVFWVGAQEISSFAHLSEDVKSVISSEKVIRLDIESHNEKAFGWGLIDNAVSSLSELVFHLWESLDYKMDADMATNLLSGIEQATNQLTYLGIRPETLEAVAVCLRRGGVRGYTQVSKEDEKDKLTTVKKDELQEKESNETEEYRENSTERRNGIVSANLPNWMMPKIFSEN